MPVQSTHYAKAEAVKRASRSGAATPGGWPLAVWLAVLVVALIARLAFVATVPRVIEWPDGQEYDQVARSLVEHGSYGLQTLRPPGYPTVIAAVYRVFGENLVALRVVEAVLGTITVGLLGLIGSSLFGRSAGLTTAILTALHPVLAFMPSTQYTENTLALVITLALGAAFAAVRSGRLRWWAATGALIGAATLVRPNVIVLFPGLALGLAWMLIRDRRKWFVPLAVSSAVLVLTLAPWIVRNHQVHGRWFFIATGGGRAIWMGNDPWTDCVTWKHPVPDSLMAAEIDRLPDEFARERYLYGKALEFMRQSPGRTVQLYFAKLGNLYSLYPNTITQLYVNRWSRWAQTAASAIIFAGALLALGSWRTHPALWPLVAGVVSFTLPNAVVYTVMRYRLAIEPCLLLMAGLGWAGGLDWVARSRWRPVRNAPAGGLPGAPGNSRIFRVGRPTRRLPGVEMGHARVIVLVSVALLLAGCGAGGSRSSTGTAADHPSATPAGLSAVEAKAYLGDHSETLVLDVRTAGEWNDDLGHIEGARQIPVDELGGRLAEIDAWKDKPVIAVCRVGVRSQRAAGMLRAAGFKRVMNLNGGMGAWRAAGY